MRNVHGTLVSAALVAALGVAALAAAAAAGEKTPRERIEELMPRLLSEEDATREAAEDELFRLGEPGRLEMERLSRDRDPRRAVTALRLLGSGRWAAPPVRAGEQALERQRSGSELEQQLADLERDLAARLEAVRQEMQKALRDARLPRLDRPGVEWPRVDWPRLRMPDLPEIEWPQIDAWSGGAAGRVEGSVTRDGRTITWVREQDGSLRVTVRDGAGAVTEMEAPTEEAFRAAHPEIARELDGLVLGWSRGGAGRAWRLRVPDAWPWRDLWGEARRAEDAEDGASEGAGPGAAATPALGITYDPPSDLLRHHLRLGASGMVVTSVLDGTLAARLGIEPRDVLVELAGKPVATAADVRGALAGREEGVVTAVVIRRGERVTLQPR